MVESEGDRSKGTALRVLIAGGGVAAAELLIALRGLAQDLVDVTLLCPRDELTYRPLAVAAPFGRNGTRAHSIDKLASDFGARRVKGELGWVAPSAHEAYTRERAPIGFDVLVVATGALREPAYPHALTFRGYEDSEQMRALVDELEHGSATRVAFVVPRGTTWTLPLYELALMSANRAPGAKLTIVSPEERPLSMFGRTASDDVAAILANAGIVFEGEAAADVPDPGTVVAGPGREAIHCDRVVALPRLRGPAIVGLPSDDEGFLPTTTFGHVVGVKDVYAAGDGTSFPIKQGGVACQQADVVAQVIARRAGVNITPTGYRPTLRGVLLTGDGSRWLRHEAPRHGAEHSDAAGHYLWWPPSKVAGAFLAPYLGEAMAADRPSLRGRAVITTGRDNGGVELVALDRRPARRALENA